VTFVAVTRPLLVSLLALTAWSCSNSQKPVDTSSIHGKWEIIDIQFQGAPSDCRKATLEIDSTSIVTYTGNLVIKASYHARKTEKGFQLELFDLSNNGARNCQGIPADYVMSHLVKQMEMEMVDGHLRAYFPDPTRKSFADFARVAPAGDGA